MHTRKEVGLGSAKPKRVEGSEALLKRGRVRKRTTWEMMAQGRFQRGDKAKKRNIES
jgi:hypothetical protein